MILHCIVTVITAKWPMLYFQGKVVNVQTVARSHQLMSKLCLQKGSFSEDVQNRIEFNQNSIYNRENDRKVIIDYGIKNNLSRLYVYIYNIL